MFSLLFAATSQLKKNLMKLYENDYTASARFIQFLVVLNNFTTEKIKKKKAPWSQCTLW
jgi:hypothetical protein